MIILLFLGCALAGCKSKTPQVRWEEDVWLPPPAEALVPAGTRVSFNKDLLSKLEAANTNLNEALDATLRRIHFFLSDELTLKSAENPFVEYRVEDNGRILKVEKPYYDEIKIPPDIPGQLTKFAKDDKGDYMLWISFDEANDRNTLAFRMNTEDDCYYPNYEETGGSKIVLYAGRRYYLSWGTRPKLLIFMENEPALPPPPARVLSGRRTPEVY